MTSAVNEAVGILYVINICHQLVPT